jgi:hypothetical protein
LLGQIILTNVFWFDPITKVILLNINKGALAYDVVGDNHSADTERPNVKKKLCKEKVFDASLNVPKLYEGSCIRELVAGGLKHEPKESGFKDIKKFLSLLGA